MAKFRDHLIIKNLRMMYPESISILESQYSLQDILAIPELVLHQMDTAA